MAPSRVQHRAGGQHRTPRALLVGVAVVILVVVVVAAGGVVAVVEAPPALAASRVLPATVTFPGHAPALDWSAQGESAVAVEGLGSLGTAGPSYPLPIASVAKVMTAYLLLIDHPLAADGSGGVSVTITPAEVADQVARAAQGQSTLPVAAGEVLTEQQLLEGLLLPSGNNIAAIIATTDAGSEAAFVAKMNAEARSLAMTSTTYSDPSGFTPSTTSTAADQLKLAEVAMAIPAFAAIVALPRVTLPVAGVVANYNSLVGTDGFTGIKTGSDSRAGGCLVFADERTVDGVRVRIIGAVLGQDAGDEATSVILGAVVAATRRLADSVASSLAVRSVLPAGSQVATVRNADGATVAVRTTTGLRQLGYGGLRVPVSVSLPPVGRRLVAGQRVATVALAPVGSAPGAGTAGVVDRTAAVARATMPKVSWSWRLRHVA